MDELLGHSITYRITIGPQVGRKVFTLQTLPAGEPDECADTAGKVSGFSLHAGVAAKADERQKLERLCRYISRPAVLEKRLSLTSNGNIRYQLKTPYRDSTTHVIFEPLDFMARLAALIPRPRASMPIIALTANASNDDRILCEQAGKDDVVTKPFKRADLSVCLQQWLPHQQASN